MTEEMNQPFYSIKTETTPDLRVSIALNWYHILIENSPNAECSFYKEMARRSFMIADAFLEAEKLEAKNG